MSFKKYLTELFDTSQPYVERDASEHPNYEYEFKFQDNVIRVYIDDIGGGNAEVNFTSSAGKDKGGFKLKATGAHPGSGQMVFSTVMQIMRDHAKKHKVSAYIFTADKKEPSRVALYRTFARLMKGKEVSGPSLDDDYVHFRMPAK